MKPYYEDRSVTIYHGDCREILPLTADLVITDPPYGIADAPQTHGLKSTTTTAVNRGGKRAGKASVNTWHPPSDWDKDLDPAWGPIVSASAPLIAWFGHWRKRQAVTEFIAHPLRCELIWSKDMHVGPPCPAAMRDERIWIFGAEGVKPNHFETTVWDEAVIPTWSRKDHKNQKPLKLMRRLVSWLPGEVVLDPFMGSGTTLRAAKDLGRKAIGIEINERYCEIAATKLAQEVLDLGA